MLRLVAKDHGLKGEDNEPVQVGTIAIPTTYFSDMQLPGNFNQEITLFEDQEDDEFDGDLGEDDEELPMIKTSIQVTEVKP